MTFSIFIPEKETRTSPPPPVLYFLSGLTSTDENARTKAGSYEEAAKDGLAVVFPDTSARGVEIEGQDEDWDFGSGAGFYLNATTDKWSKNYNMYDYVTKELPQFIDALFSVDSSKTSKEPRQQSRVTVWEGGHGALTLHLKNPGQY